MQVTRHIVAERIAAYLQSRQTLAELVDFAEGSMIECEFDSDATRDVVARLGVSDVRAFGLTWDDCRTLLRSLGYTARVEVAA